MMMELRTNPYHPNVLEDLHSAAYVSVPFAGRKDALGRLYQQMNQGTPGATRSLCFVGRRHGGKTALLLALNDALNDTTAGARIFLDHSSPEDETDWILMLAQSVTEAMIEQDAPLGRLNELTPPDVEQGEDVRAWLVDRFLPIAFQALKRRLVIFIDDAEHLLNGMRSGSLPYDTFSFLHVLVEAFPDLGFVLTLDAEYEPEIDSLSPLIGLQDSVRLTNLAPDETRWLLQSPAEGCYTVTDDAAAAVQRLTGGTPALAQHVGFLLFERWLDQPDIAVFTADDIRALSADIQRYGEADAKYNYVRLTPNEKRVLMAVSQLTYANPLKKVDPQSIVSWLAESDHPLDLTAIHAALRGLEYADIVRAAPDGVVIASGVMQTWLLENSGRVPSAPSAGGPLPAIPRPTRATSTFDPFADEVPVSGTRRGVPVRRALLMALGAAVLGALTAIVVFSAPPQTATTVRLAPTVTLANTPTQ